MWTYDQRYFYIGRSRKLSHRLRQHLLWYMSCKSKSLGTSNLHTRVARKYWKNANVYILAQSKESGQWSDVESYWIRKACERLGPAGCTNVMFTAVGSRGQADRVAKQWEDPNFQRVNADRLRRLRDSGWASTSVQQLRVTTPSGAIYRILTSELKSVFSLGTQGGSISVFDRSYVFADWLLEQGDRGGGYARPPSDFSIFIQDPDVIQVMALKKCAGEKAFNLTPSYATIDGVVYKALRHTDLRAKFNAWKLSLSWHERRTIGSYVSNLHKFKSYTDYLAMDAVVLTK